MKKNARFDVQTVASASHLSSSVHIFPPPESTVSTLRSLLFPKWSSPGRGFGLTRVIQFVLQAPTRILHIVPKRQVHCKPTKLPNRKGNLWRENRKETRYSKRLATDFQSGYRCPCYRNTGLTLFHSYTWRRELQKLFVDFEVRANLFLQGHRWRQFP